MNQIYSPLRIQECIQKRSHKKSQTQNFLRARYLNRKKGGRRREKGTEGDGERGRKAGRLCVSRQIYL